MIPITARLIKPMQDHAIGVPKYPNAERIYPHDVIRKIAIPQKARRLSFVSFKLRSETSM